MTKLTDLNEVLEDVLSLLSDSLLASGAEVVVNRLTTVMADRVLLSQVFQNLLSNCVKYRRPEEPLRVEVAAERRGDEWIIAVRDNGTGIDSNDSERIFDPLVRLHGAGIPGSGIGLSVCRRIVERHGGRIWVESQTGLGSTFFFSLPAPQKGQCYRF